MKNKYYDINLPLHKYSPFPVHIVQGYMINNGLANSCEGFDPCRNNYILEYILENLIDNDEKISFIDENNIELTLNHNVRKDDIKYIKMIFWLLFIDIDFISSKKDTVNIKYKFMF